MEEFAIIANQTLTNEETVIYSNSRGAVIKTILLNAPMQTEVVLVFDEIPFSFLIGKETIVISGNDLPLEATIPLILISPLL